MNLLIEILYFSIGLAWLLIGYLIVTKKVKPGNDSIIKLVFRVLIGLFLWPLMLIKK